MDTLNELFLVTLEALASISRVGSRENLAGCHTLFLLKLLDPEMNKTTKICFMSRNTNLQGGQATGEHSLTDECNRDSQVQSIDGSPFAFI